MIESYILFYPRNFRRWNVHFADSTNQLVPNFMFLTAYTGNQ